MNVIKSGLARNALLALLGVVLVLSSAAAQEASDGLYARPSDMQWWRKARFGLFVHWNPISLRGTEIGWSRGGQVPIEEYDSLYKQFNPTKFDPDEWVRVAKAAGVKYMVFTTKHHDGFCMFDTKLTDYKITNSPYGKDITAQLAAACHRHGLRIGFYYSPADWHHPDFGKGRDDTRARYVKYLHGQLRELCTGYGKISVIWFDSKNIKGMDSPGLFRMIRQLQPGIIINDRGGLPGDYDTREQFTGGFQDTRLWESCLTLGQQWSWKPNDEIKTTKTCIDALVQCAGGDGNLLLNVGPMPDGRIEPRQVDRLGEIGAWMRKYGRTVHGTRGGPYVPTDEIASTRRGDTVYVHVLKWPDGKGELELQPMGRRIVASRLLTGGTVRVAQSRSGIRISISPEDRDPLDTIVALKLDGPASDIAPIREPTVTAGKPSTSSSVMDDDLKACGPANAVDNDLTTVWTAAEKPDAAWLEVDAGKLVSVGRVVINEAVWHTREFELQYQQGGEWHTFLKGERIGPSFTAAFAPVTARRFRLNVTKATSGPAIREFHLLQQKKQEHRLLSPCKPTSP